MKRILCYLEMIMAEAEYHIARNRWLQHDDNKLWYIVTWGKYERAKASYDYAVKCANEQEDESRRPE